ncbi:phosphomannomutase/phosphoglucomutase [Congregibacter litoralis]|uniref:phosphomannomutase n=1 Tax=Congregibacter litoralis KT71 TaxID=314285 RepID=A4A9B4_9GAMM|nr:phosphomannomutase/phosphoglucomutase [Congregibacter litoralis]EAQ97656.1 phosphomannomutase [Congregibacter litoralis KT71]
MLKLPGKKNPKPGKPTKATSDEQRNTQGVSARGNTLRSALLLGFLIVLVPLLLATAYLALLHAPLEKSALIQRVADSYASQQARYIGNSVAALRSRVESAVGSPLALQAIAEQNPADIRLVEQAMLDYFPQAVSLRLLPLSDMGTADLAGGFQGLRNHIEVDLVRRVSNNEPAEPEAYQFEGQWLVSLAQVATHPRISSRRAVVLLTLDTSTFEAMLNHPEGMVGEFALEQRVYSEGADRDIRIASQGSGADAPASTAKVNDTPWRVLFVPSSALVNEVSSHVSPPYGVLGILMLCCIFGFVFALQRSSKALDSELERIIDGAEHRTPLDVHIPQLVPLAKDLRKLTLRRARMGNTSNIVPAVDTHSAAHTNTAMTAVDGPATQGLSPHIFRAYDIRGVADTDLDDETVYRIGSAIATIAGELGEQTLCIGYDGRASSSRIKGVIEKAVLQAGRDVIDIGLVPTPLLYFATSLLEAKSGVMITGSHNPAEYNGLKIVLKGQTIAEGTIEKIRNIAQTGRFSKGTGHAIQRDVVSDYLDEVVSDIAIAVPLKIVVDAGNGATGHIAPALLEELGCEVIPLFCDVDGRFPNRSPDTGNEDNLSALVREVLSNAADFGVAYDGDGDRVVVVTGSGRIIRSDTLMMIFARDVVTRNPGADVVYDVKCSRNLAQLITGLGGRPVLWKTGHALMKEKMVETGALLGGEFSGHIFFGERWYGFDDGMYATGRLAEILSSQDQSIDDFISDLPVAVSTPEIIIPVPDDEKFALMQKFIESARFADGKPNDLDGLRVDFQDGWGLLRASNTGPALTARFEAGDEAGLEKIRSLFREQLAAVAPDLNIPF